MNKLPHLALALALAGTMAACQAQPRSTTDKAGGGFGLELRPTATVADVEMPLYPKAERLPDSDDNAGAVRMGLWGGSFGFRLAALKMGSADAPAEVTAFYREALARHGEVLECHPPKAGEVAEKKADDKSENKAKKNSQPRDDRPLDCEDNKPRPGGLVLKVGTRKDFRLVAIKPHGKGTQFDLLRIAVRE